LLSSPLPHSFNAKLSPPHERGIFAALFNTMTHVHLLQNSPNNFHRDSYFMMRQLGSAVGVTVSTAVFSSVGSTVGRTCFSALLSCFWRCRISTCFRGLGVLGHCTIQPASISKIEKGGCLDEGIPSPANMNHTARTSSEKKILIIVTYNWKTRIPCCNNIDATKLEQEGRMSAACIIVILQLILHNIY